MYCESLNHSLSWFLQNTYYRCSFSTLFSDCCGDWHSFRQSADPHSQMRCISTFSLLIQKRCISELKIWISSWNFWVYGLKKFICVCYESLNQSWFLQKHTVEAIPPTLSFIVVNKIDSHARLNDRQVPFHLVRQQILTKTRCVNMFSS